MALQNVQRLFWKSNSNKNITCCDPDIKSKQQRYLTEREKKRQPYRERKGDFQAFRIVLHQNPQHRSRSLHCHARWLSLWMVFVLSNWKSLWRHECNFILCCQVGSISLPCVPQYKGLPQDNQWEMLQRYAVRMQRIEVDTICQGASSINAFPSKFPFFFGFEKFDETKCRLLCAALQSLHNNAAGLQ